MTSKTFTLKDLAEAGYIMGLPTIGDVVDHVERNYDAYWNLKEVGQRVDELRYLVAGRESDSIEKYITEEDRQEMDEEMERAMGEGPEAANEEITPMT